MRVNKGFSVFLSLIPIPSKPSYTADTDASSVYEADDMKIQSLTDFNLKIQKEGEEVRKLLDLALSEKKETEKVRGFCGLYMEFCNYRYFFIF